MGTRSLILASGKIKVASDIDIDEEFDEGSDDPLVEPSTRLENKAKEAMSTSAKKGKSKAQSGEEEDEFEDEEIDEDDMDDDDLDDDDLDDEDPDEDLEGGEKKKKPSRTNEKYQQKQLAANENQKQAPVTA